MPGLSSVLDGWLGILFLIKDAAVLYEKNKNGSSVFMPRPPPFQHRIVTVRFRFSPNPAVGKSALFYSQPELETNGETRTYDIFHLYPE